jgi:transcriptional regulator with XRE-family HTH domain
MADNIFTVAPGFGPRLRDERKRLGMTQTEFAAMAGVQRLAQGQYEGETRAPNVHYLSAIAAGGANLIYLLFGQFVSNNLVSPDVQRKIDRKVFDLLEEYVKLRCGGQLSSEARFVLYEVWRAALTQTANKSGNVDELTLADLNAVGG